MPTTDAYQLLHVIWLLPGFLILGMVIGGVAALLSRSFQDEPNHNHGTDPVPIKEPPCNPVRGELLSKHGERT